MNVDTTLQAETMQLNWPDSFTFISKSIPDGHAISAATLCDYATTIATLLRAKGVTKGDRVALWITDGPGQLGALFACWMVGATFCVLPSFAGRTNTDRSQDRVRGVLDTLQPKLLLQGQGLALPEALTGAFDTGELPEIAATPASTQPPVDVLENMSPNDLAFIQFTSGSTGGNARGAEVRFKQLMANLDTLAARTQMGAADRMVSWAPMYHDMGLMAVLLPMRVGAELVLIETDHFVRRPAAWLEAISTHKGTVSTAPPTALKLLARRKAAGIDLSSWRYAWIGGEAVFPKVLDDFNAAYAQAGLTQGVLQPTYGMAETVVGISCGLPGTPYKTKDGVISCGPVLDGMEVQIIDGADAALPHGTEGRVMVRGPSVISGYLGLPRHPEGAWFETGDAGFLQDGQLYITGRLKDVLKRGAESYPATLVETIAEDALGLRTGRVAAFASLRADIGKEEIVLLVESRDWAEENARIVSSAVVAELGLQIDVIRNAKTGRLPRTSSGKLMRQLTASQYREGLL